MKQRKIRAALLALACLLGGWSVRADGSVFYYNPRGGKYYHRVRRCPTIRAAYHAGMAELPVEKLAERPYNALQRCPCNTPGFLSGAILNQAKYPEGDPLPLQTEVLDGVCNQDGYSAVPLVIRLTAPNGQKLHLVSHFAKPVAHKMDVNFDGRDDLAVMVDPGGTNPLYRLFVWENGRYFPVDDGAENGLSNPSFHPDQRMVCSHAVSGLAGALHEDVLMRWAGRRLVPFRRAVCSYAEEGRQEGDVYIATTYQEKLRARVYALEPSGDRPLFDEAFDLRAQGMDEAYLEFYGREMDALWMGE